MTFQVQYFDGISSKTHQAFVSPSSLSWKISYKDEFSKEILISWNISKIKKADVYTKGLVSFNFGDHFPFQKIESNDPTFINYINTSEHNSLNNKVDIILHKTINRSISYLLLFIIGIALGMYFYVIPSVTTNFVTSLNEKSVISFGDYVFKVLSTSLDINDEKSEKLQDFVDTMSMNSVFPLKTYVIDSDELNAFALSGGKIVIFSALLEKIENESQLSALIGHEVSHIENRHVLKNMSKNMSGAIFVSILFGDVNGATALLADNAHLFSQLSYARNLEKEADIFGLEIMRRNKLDMDGMPQLFEILEEESQIDIPTYLSNHPMLKDRIEYTQKIANEQEEGIKNDVLKEKWKNIQDTFEN